jgi:hypothetical protein
VIRPDVLEAEAHELMARAHAKLAEAARLRARSFAATSSDWIDATSLPLPRKTVLRACRAGELRASKRGRRWLCTRADADAYLASATPKPTHANDAEADVRARLGLAPRRSA